MAVLDLSARSSSCAKGLTVDGGPRQDIKRPIYALLFRDVQVFVLGMTIKKADT